MKEIHAVGAIFQNEQGQVLVLKRHPQDPEGGLWGLVGGKIDNDETPAKAIQREVYEEIGQIIDTEKLSPVKAYTWARDELRICFTVYAVLPQKNIAIVLDPKEHTASMWASPAELYQRNDLMAGLYPVLKDRYNLR